MKILFLDIDGVIKTDVHGSPFFDDSLDILKSILDRTGAVIVMSSSWKVKYKAFVDNGYKTDIYDIQRLYEALCRHGLTITDYTPYLGEIDWSLRRPVEIKEYLKSAEDVESFCILDERDEFPWDDLSDNLVLTLFGKDENGEKIAYLAPEHEDRIVAILNKIY